MARTEALEHISSLRCGVVTLTVASTHHSDDEPDVAPSGDWRFASTALDGREMLVASLGEVGRSAVVGGLTRSARGQSTVGLSHLEGLTSDFWLSSRPGQARLCLVRCHSLEFFGGVA